MNIPQNLKGEHSMILLQHSRYRACIPNPLLNWIPVFITTQFSVAKLRDPCRHAAKDECIKKMWFWTQWETYSPARKWMNQEITVLSEIARLTKPVLHLHCWVCNLGEAWLQRKGRTIWDVERTKEQGHMRKSNGGTECDQSMLTCGSIIMKSLCIMNIH